MSSANGEWRELPEAKHVVLPGGVVTAVSVKDRLRLIRVRDGDGRERPVALCEHGGSLKDGKLKALNALFRG